MPWFILEKGHTNVRCAIKICTNRFHTEEKPFKCKQCDLVFTQEIYFIHMAVVTHKNVRNFSNKFISKKISVARPVKGIFQ